MLHIDPRHDDLRTDDPRAPERRHVSQPPGLDPRHDDRRSPLRLPPDTYGLSARDLETLRTIGSFRAVRSDDLHETLHVSPRALRTLQAQRLLDRRRVDDAVYLTLTREGQRVVRAADPGVVIHRGFVKPRELLHDAALYRMYQAHARMLREAGATLERVRLDYELKSLVQRAVDKRAEAEALGLPYDPATQRVQFPDLQIEYRAPGGERERVNLELSTEHYSTKTLREKAAAGFILYGLRAGGAAASTTRRHTGGGGGHRHRDIELYSL
ncbi:MAG: hypothetical protein GEU99_23465 [Luteitalea sp.]|nr:hypothetical protein [Luteitalea sp.]